MKLLVELCLTAALGITSLWCVAFSVVAIACACGLERPQTPLAIRLAVQFGLASFSLWVLITVVAAVR